MGFNIVLIEPEIPMNTGNIGRLSLGSGSKLHLVKPFGFELNDKRLIRAGLDYWKHISLFIYESIDDFFSKNKGKYFAYFSSHGAQDYCSCNGWFGSVCDDHSEMKWSIMMIECYKSTQKWFNAAPSQVRKTIT